MHPYSVTMELAKAGEVTLTLWGKDRDDVIAFAKKNYRKVLKKVKSARQVAQVEVAATG